MTGKLNNVYVKNTALTAGKLEKEGMLGKYFDKSYDDYNIDESLELSEVKMAKDALNILLKKTKLKKDDIELFVGGDLLNQICATSYAVEGYNKPFLGVFSACATSMESIIIASSFIENQNINNAICLTSSHNLAEEKQFRNPTEYGYTKPKTATFTSTGGAAILLTNEKTDIKITNYTIGKIVDMNQADVNNMGAVMAPAAGDVIYNHLKDTKRDISYYDLILTGDLGIYGKNILKDYMMTKYNIKLNNNYNDCGTMLYDLDRQPVLAGASGPACLPLVVFSYIYKEMLKKKYKKVLIVPTGAVFSPTFTFQKESIPSIANAISLEVI